MEQRQSVIDRQRELSEIIGPPGHEHAVASYLLQAVRPHADRAWVDPLGNVLAERSGTGGAARPLRILLDGHTDEVGFIVTHVEERGFLRVEALGGIDKRLMLGTSLEFLADSGERVTGIVGCLPPHVTTASERDRVPEIADMFVDIGAPDAAEAARRGIRVGSVGTFATRFALLGTQLMTGKAFDDRTACNVMIHVLERLARERCPNTLLLNFAVQEEVGIRGAGSGAWTLKPDIALAIENTTATDVPGVPAAKVVAELGKGPCITVADRSHIVPPAVLERLRAAAEGLDWQYKKPLYGGTDASRIATTGGGIMTGVVSVPCRYIHGPTALLCISDVVATIELVARFCSLAADDLAPLVPHTEEC